LLVEPEVEKPLISIGSDTTLDQLQVKIASLLKWDEKDAQRMKISYWDKEFEEYVNLTDVNHLSAKTKIRVKKI
jgi:hypothetical protein